MNKTNMEYINYPIGDDMLVVSTSIATDNFKILSENEMIKGDLVHIKKELQILI